MHPPLEVPMSATRSAQVVFANRTLSVPGPELGLLRDSGALRDDAPALRARLDEDGYLFIRGLHDRSLVLDARRQMLTKLAAAGALDPTAPLMEGRIAAGNRGGFHGGLNELTACPAYQELIRGKRCLRFFDFLRGGPTMTYDYQWLRVIGKGDCTGAHLDVIYMGRGTHNLLTMWTPLGDITYDQGPLALCAGSHRDPRFERLRATYGNMDVDRDRISGANFTNPLEFGHGSWLTSEFQAGDALIFGMFTLHASLTHTGDCYRLSSDTRYQLASEPVDERWVGASPMGHLPPSGSGAVSLEEKRKEWGV